jgi:Arc/MetJ family transcription regulator
VQNVTHYEQALILEFSEAACERRFTMASNLSIDNELMNIALKVGGFKSKKDTVNQALKEFVKSRKTAEIIELFGTIEYDSNYDYKDTRRLRQ